MVTKDELVAFASSMRAALEECWSADTGAPGTEPVTPSAGQCAATSVVFALAASEKMEPIFASTRVEGVSHWFNRVRTEDGSVWDVDLTGDQFGRPPCQVGPAGTLYPETRERAETDLNGETLGRAMQLFVRFSRRTTGTAPIEIIEIEDEHGERMFLSWGIHDAQAFRDACRSQRGVWWPASEDPSWPVRYACYIKLADGAYEPVMGVPNATVLSA